MNELMIGAQLCRSSQYECFLHLSDTLKIQPLLHLLNKVFL